MCELEYNIIYGKETPDLLTRASKMVEPLWPEFMLHDEIGNSHWGDLYERFGEYQFALEDDETGELFASANSIPLYFEGDLDDLPEEGWDWAMKTGVAGHKQGLKPNLLCAIQIAIVEDYRGIGLSPFMLDLMRELTDREQLPALIAPVRPNLKPKYPLTEIDDYVEWTNDQGEMFDPWLRVHQKAGATLIAPCHEAMRIEGSISDWESWTDTKFPVSGKYVIPGALTPIDIDLKSGRGLYLEPNVWMAHPIR